MKKHDRYPLWKKIKYSLNGFVSKGLWAQVLLLVGVSFLLTILFGAAVMNLGQPDYGEAYWDAMMHMLDQGTITADEAGTDGYFMFMLFVTFVGMAFTGTIVAIITAAIQGKMTDLEKGHSPVVEHDHVVILGFDGNTGTICSEIIEDGKINGERITLVLADDLPKETMEQDLKEYHGNPLIPNGQEETKSRLKVIIRSGDLVSENTFSMCSVEKARAILISRENDLETVRILLALTGYLKKKGLYREDGRPEIIALIHDINCMPAARAAAGLTSGNNTDFTAYVLNDDETMGQYFAQTCVQRGFPYVLDGLFNPRDTSICIEKAAYRDDSPFIGKTLQEISGMVTGSIPLGFVRRKEGKPDNILLNPLDVARYQKGDRLIYLSDRPELKTGKHETASPVGYPLTKVEEIKQRRNLLVVGWSDAVPDMLKSISAYCTDESTVSIIDTEVCNAEECCMPCRQIDCGELRSWNDMKKILDANEFWFDSSDSRRLTDIFVLSRNRADKIPADELVMALVLNIRQYLSERGITGVNIMSELQLPQDQMLLLNRSINDFVASSEISNHMMTKLLDDPVKYCIIKNLLKPESDMIRLNPLSDYVDTGREFNFECVFRSSASRGETTGRAEIPLGWIKLGGANGDSNLVLIPEKEDLERVYPAGDYSSWRLVALSGIGYFTTDMEKE